MMLYSDHSSNLSLTAVKAMPLLVLIEQIIFNISR